MAKPSPGASIDSTSLTNGIIACWPFWENTGTPKEIISDTSPSSSANFSWGSGPNGSVGVFGGNTNLSYSSVSAVGPAMSVAIGINWPTLPSADSYIIQRVTGTTTWGLLTNATNLIVWHGAGSSRYASTSVITAATWQSWVVTDGGTIVSYPEDTAGYLSGSANTNQAYDGGAVPASNTNVIHIGNSDGTYGLLTASIDYIYIWNRAITSTEAGLIYTDPWQIFTTGPPATVASGVAAMMDF